MEARIETTPLGSRLAVYQAGSGAPHVFMVGGLGGRSLARSPAGTMLEAAARHGASGTIVDLSGTGGSKYAGELTMHTWISDVEHVYSRFARGASIWIGSSIGGWLMLLVHRRHPEWFKSMCALAPALDWDARFLQPGIRDGNLSIADDNLMVGVAALPMSLVRSMAIFRMLDAPLLLRAPLHVIHGDEDREAPVDASRELLKAAHGAACELEIIPGEGHDVAKLGTRGSQKAFERWLYHQVTAP